MAKILIIDDEQIIRDRLKSLLELDKYNTFTAEDGIRGLVLFDKERPDVVLVDIKMPKMDGIEVLKRIKEKSTDSEVIVITGHGGVDTAIEALKEGAFGYIQKPVEFDELEIDIKKALERQEMKRSLDTYVNRLERMVKEWETTFNSVRDMISIHDDNFMIVKVNSAFAEKYKSKPADFVGKSCHEVLHHSDKPIQQCLYNRIKENKEPCVADFFEDSLGIYLEASVSPILNDKGEITGSVHVTKDITKRKKMEEEIMKSLREKEVLLREIHHRVKNNLQIISSLLDLQLNRTDDNKTREILIKSRNRVKSMSLIHEQLYGSENLSSIDFSEYIRSLTNDLLYSYKDDSLDISLVMDIDNIVFNIETAIPCGLIINELLSNALKHAFPNLNSGEIQITLHSLDDNWYKLLFSDNGVGLTVDVENPNRTSLGLRLVKSLSMQLDGEMKVDVNNGTTFSIEFKDQVDSDTSSL